MTDVTIGVPMTHGGYAGKRCGVKAGTRTAEDVVEKLCNRWPDALGAYLVPVEEVDGIKEACEARGLTVTDWRRP